MTFVPPPASGIATRRIGLANGLLWILATVVLVVVGATTAYQYVVQPYQPGGDIFEAGDPYGYPWELEDPIVADEIGGNEWTADGSAVIRIPAAEFQEPRRASISAGADLDIYRTNPRDVEVFPDERPWPDNVGWLYGDQDVMIVPTGDDVELWIQAEGPWQLRLEPVDVAIADDFYSGKGNGLVMYRGDAVSARLSHIGEGVFFVDVYTAFESDTPIIESGDWEQRVSWATDSWVVFEIESDADRGAWTIDIEELARPTPTATETPR
jgi:hypothetical protein